MTAMPQRSLCETSRYLMWGFLVLGRWPGSHEIPKIRRSELGVSGFPGRVAARGTS